MLLRSRFAHCLNSDVHLPCPLCRAPVLAASLSQVPRRERPLAISLDAAFLGTDTANSTGLDSAADAQRACAVVIGIQTQHGDKDPSKCFKVTLKHSSTGPLEHVGKASRSLVPRS